MGNIRLSYWGAHVTISPHPLLTEIVEDNHYPFPKGRNNVVNGTENPYDHNNKENQKELGPGLNRHDFGAPNTVRL